MTIIKHMFTSEAGQRGTIYVHHNEGIINSVHLGGDYMEITDRLSTTERARLCKQLKLRF